MKNKLKYESIYRIKETDTTKEATAKYFSGKSYRKDKVAALFKDIYNGETGEFLLNVSVDEQSDKYSVKLTPIHGEKEDKVDIPVLSSLWEINSDGYYPYCINCKFEPDRDNVIKYGLPDVCPGCGALMKNYTDLNRYINIK